MHRNDPSKWRHAHTFALHSDSAERRTRLVIAITATMMGIEIVAGSLFNSMALLVDGWHMGTHVAAFVITAIAYYFSRKHASDLRYSFGTGKLGVLGGFSSAIVLAVVALLMAGESVHRIAVPLPIRFNEALVIALLGLGVNLACALVLQREPRDHEHDHAGGHSDLNLKSAYVHVMADALTSVTAITALLGGKFFGWSWLDPIMGLVGSGMVSVWAYGLIRDTSGILLDRTPASSDLPEVIRRTVEADGDSLVRDLHVWQLGTNKYAAIVAIIAHNPRPIEVYRRQIAVHEELVHLTIEAQRCDENDQ